MKRASRVVRQAPYHAVHVAGLAVPWLLHLSYALYGVRYEFSSGVPELVAPLGYAGYPVQVVVLLSNSVGYRP